ncbi:MAG TPA: hypothetical protein ENK18_11380 [Deltaproteobacteria bacterium]|nr:hypothetical protein [Deltaproteobacteria bacterium]
MALWMYLGGCGGPSSPPPPPPPPVVLPEPPPAPSSTRVPDPTSEWMLSLASGARPPTELLDPQRGFTLVEVFPDPDDPEANAQGQVRRAERLCGDEAGARLERLQADLAARSGGGQDDVFHCSGPVCTHPPRTPDDLSGSYAFQAPDDHLVLELVVRIGGIPRSPHAQQEIEAWVDARIDELDGQPCPGSRLAPPADIPDGPSGEGSDEGSDALPPDEEPPPL